MRLIILAIRVYGRSRHRSAKVHAFVDFVAEVIDNRWLSR